jgi:hypothetical protein
MNIDHGVRNSIYCTLRHKPLSCSAPQRTESRAPCRGRGGLTTGWLGKVDLANQKPEGLPSHVMAQSRVFALGTPPSI